MVKASASQGIVLLKQLHFQLSSRAKVTYQVSKKNHIHLVDMR